MPDEKKELLRLEDFAAVQDESRGFSADQMVACEQCVRANPPTRLNCLYCGASLPVTAESASLRRPSLRPLEEWERGFNVLLLPEASKEFPAESLAEAASLLRLEEAQLHEMVGAGCALPLARAASADEAGLLATRLRALGFSTETFTDEELAPEACRPKRIRALELAGETLSGRTSTGNVEDGIAWRDVALLVAGRLYTRRIELEERQGRFKARGAIAESREVATDEAVLDIYFDGERLAVWRITSDNFDYSCLGERKTLLAKDNFNTLIALLRERAPVEHLFDDYYGRVRHLLSAAWPPQERTESRGLRRERPGKFNTEAVTTVGNEMQFTRYSQLRRLLRRRAL